MSGVKPFASLFILLLLVGGCAHHHHHHEGEGRLDLNDLPQIVQDHFSRDHANVEIKGIQKDIQGGVTHYEIDFEDQGVRHSAIYDREGDAIVPDAKLP